MPSDSPFYDSRAAQRLQTPDVGVDDLVGTVVRESPCARRCARCSAVR